MCSLWPGLIAEVILYSEGFESSKNLAQKMTQMYKLCSEQLSQQDHYDFGMRALKSVLVMAGSLKRQNPDKNEDVVLIRALRDSNLPKFLKDDAVLFQVRYEIGRQNGRNTLCWWWFDICSPRGRHWYHLNSYNHLSVVELQLFGYSRMQGES